MPEPRPLPPAPLDAPPPGWTVPEGWRPDNLGHCRSCNDGVLWCFTPSGRKAPVNRDGTSHFATCPHADAWRRGPGQPAAARVSPDSVARPVVSRLHKPPSGGAR